jgi:hypothetical protein
MPATKTKTTSPKPLDIERELDEVVGRYEPHAGERWLSRYGRWLARALLAACLAVAAAVLVVGTLDRYMQKAQRAPPPPRPVIVEIVPAK